jgi:hypothetical protein
MSFEMMTQRGEPIMTDDIHWRNLPGGKVDDYQLLFPIVMGDVSEGMDAATKGETLYLSMKIYSECKCFETCEPNE